MDICTYGGRNAKTVTDVFWKEGCHIPDVLVSEVITLIERGLVSASSDDARDQIFEASLLISQVNKATTLDDLKKYLANFRNEMYTQKSGKVQGQFLVHFYKRQRARDAFTYIKNTPSQFSNVEMVVHKKEIGTGSELTPAQAAQQAQLAEKKKKREKVLDDEGFEMIK